MEIPRYTPQILRQKLINYIDFLLPKPHIKSVMSLRYYKMKLDLDECLTARELEHIFKFLVRDSDRTLKELRQIFHPITATKNNEKPTPTLEEFLT